VLVLAALNREHVLLGPDCQVFRAEASQRQRDLIMIFAGTLDIVGRVIVVASPARGRVEETQTSTSHKQHPDAQGWREGGANAHATSARSWRGAMRPRTQTLQPQDGFRFAEPILTG